MNISGQTVLVTGAAKRIGRAIAIRMAQLGANVVIHYNKSQNEAERVRKEIEILGARAMTVSADLGHPEQIEKMVEKVNAKMNHVDILINSAAIFHKTPLETVTPEQWQSMLDVNLTGPFWCSRYFGLLMKQQGAGCIVNIACAGGVRPWPNYSAYCVSKAGLIMLTQVLAHDLAPHVRVNAILSGQVMLPENHSESDMQNAQQKNVLKRIGTSNDIIRAVEFLVTHADYTTGACIPVDGGRIIL